MIQINRAGTLHAIMTSRPVIAAAAAMVACRHHAHGRPAAASPENVMMRLPNRIVLATLGVFIALSSLLGVVHAMLVGVHVLPYAILALVSGVAAFVAQLDSAAGEDS
ncbi:DUF2964 family protein [Burkholderia cepacia]|uniref:DUF2964 family protein n=1 Tax=Burkholderia cepacia TaxID=292 RepID=UPI0029F07B7F|nr:hypothetical protein [Burkholderia cepacia]